MKLRLNTDQLRKAVSSLMKAVPSKALIPIYDSLLVEPDGDRLRITASDGELTVSTMVTLEENSKGSSFAIPPTVLNDLLKNLPSGEITIEQKQDYSVNIIWDCGASVMPVFEARDFPLPAKPADSAASISSTQKILKEAIEKTAFAASPDNDVRPVLTGVLLDCTGDTLSLAASDTHKMMIYQEGQIAPERPVQAIIPRKAAMMLKGMLEKEGQVEMKIDDSSAHFLFGANELTTRLINGRYPDYKSVIPKNNENLLTVGRNDILNIIRRISVCSDRASMMLRMDLGTDSIRISAQDLGFSISAKETMQCTYDGQSMSIGFKAPMIIEVLSAIESDEVNLYFGAPNRALLVTPSDPTAEPVKGIVMPSAIK